MSQLDQAKKEAKRLFNMAKENNSTVIIENLSKAREILSVVNGYKDWHEYESVLKRKDFMLDKTDKNTENKNKKEIENNLSYYTQEIVFRKITSTGVGNYNMSTIEQQHKPIILGNQKSVGLFGGEKQWILNEYPLLVAGITGAGKTEALLSMVVQYVKNKEGFIYIDGKGDVSIYPKLFSYMSEHNRLNDLYCLNFLADSEYFFGKEDDKKEKFSHSIDPINPMVGNENYFNYFFGRIGTVIHEILKEINNKNELMDIESLESCLMLSNLIQWNEEKIFNTEAIGNYLNEIGVSCDEYNFDDVLKKHAIHCDMAFKTISLLKKYQHIFKVDCSINMEEIFLKRKGLVVMLPSLLKSADEISELGELIASQIRYVDEKYSNSTHFQNIIFDEFSYYTNTLMNMNFKSTKNNYIFGVQDFYYKNQIVNYILVNAKTTLIMKSCGEIHQKTKLDLLILEEFPKLKAGNNGPFIELFEKELRNLNEGQAYVLSKNFTKNKSSYIINNDNKFYCEYIVCSYIPAKRPNKIYLVEHQCLNNQKQH